MAVSVWLASPLLHAEPLDTYTSRLSRKWSIVSLLTPSTEKFTSSGSASAGLFSTIPGIPASASRSVLFSAAMRPARPLSAKMCIRDREWAGLPEPDAPAVLAAYKTYLGMDSLADWAGPEGTKYAENGLYSASAGLLLACQSGFYVAYPDYTFEAGGDQQRMYFSLSAASVEESTCLLYTSARTARRGTVPRPGCAKAVPEGRTPGA